MLARDALDSRRAVKHAAIIERYAPLRGAKVLEIGSGFGTNLVAWTKVLGADMYGIEPSSPEWGNSFQASKLLMAENGIDSDRIVDALGEALPFGDNQFDIVYSGNVLEHVQDPEKVLFEGLRVLRPGGLLHFEVPNYMSYFEGHYSLFKPPVSNRAMLAWWIRLRGKEPAFVRTMNIVHPSWCKKIVKNIEKSYQLDLLSLGEDIFLERFATPWRFETEQSADEANSIVSVLQSLNYRNWIGRTIVALNGFYPIFLTIRKIRSLGAPDGTEVPQN